MKKNLYINQIFRGIAPSQYFGEEGTYNSATGIDPDLPIVSTDVRTSGFPVPVGSSTFSVSHITGPVIRQITHPKDNRLWTVQTNGKIVTYDSAQGNERLIGTVTGSNATWAEYYNNFIYVFGTGALKDDVSRIGPLNTLPYDAQSANFTVGLTVTGATSLSTGIIIADVDGGATGTLTLSNIVGQFQDNETITDTSTGSATVNRTDASLITNNVWKGATLGTQTALVNTKYPALRGVDMPNHLAHVHSDGSMYFCDFKDGQGLIHRVNTRRVTNEGDTNGTTVPSAYNALDLPFGFYPTSIANYGTDVLITGIYTVDTVTNQGSSAFIIWDPTDTATFHTGPIPLADPLATACRNVNGSVYIWTGNAQNGVRLSLYNGGVSVRELVYQEEGVPPLGGAVDALGNRVIWGGSSTYPTITGAVFAYGSKRADLPTGVHSVSNTSTASVESLVDSYDLSNYFNTNTDTTMAGTTTNSRGKGQSFTAIAGQLKRVDFYQRNEDGTATGTLVAKLYAHTGTFGTLSLPTGSALATSNSVDVASIPSSQSIVSYTFSTPYTLVAGVNYVIVFQIQSTGEGRVLSAIDFTSSTHAGNRVFESTPNSWGVSSADLIFYVYAENEGNINVTALKYAQQNSNITPKVVYSWGTSNSYGINRYSTEATLSSTIRWMFNIGTKFDITRVSLPLAGVVSAGVIITPTIFVDDLSSNYTLPAINNTNYPGRRKVTYKGAELKNITGFNNFMLEITYSGTVPVSVGLPIIIQIDIKDDE